MTFHSPFDQPSYAPKKKAKKAKRKAKKKVSKARRKKKKAKKKVAKRPARKPVTGSVRTGCPTRKKKSVPGAAEIIRVSKGELEKLRKNVAKPTWTDLLPESKRKVFTYKRRRFWPVYSLLYMISAIEVELGFKPHKIKRGELARAHRVRFVQRGSLIDV